MKPRAFQNLFLSLVLLMTCAIVSAQAQTNAKRLTLRDLATRDDLPLRRWIKGESSDPLPPNARWSLVFETIPLNPNSPLLLFDALRERGVWLDGDACAVIYARNPNLRSLRNLASAPSIILPRLVRNSSERGIATISLYEAERAFLMRRLNQTINTIKVFLARTDIRGNASDVARARESVDKIRSRCQTIREGNRNKLAPVTAAQFEQADEVLLIVLQTLNDGMQGQGKPFTPKMAELLADATDEAQIVEKAFAGDTRAGIGWQQPPPETQPVHIQVFRQNDVGSGRQAEKYFVYYKTWLRFRQSKYANAHPVRAMTPQALHELAVGYYVFWAVPAKKPNSAPLGLREKLDVSLSSPNQPLVIQLAVP